MISETTMQAIRKFTSDRDWDRFHTPENLAKSISIEAAELLECYQWSPEDPQWMRTTSTRNWRMYSPTAS